MAENYPVLVLLAPFFTAIAVCVVGFWKPVWCLPLAIVSLVASTVAAIKVLLRVIVQGEIVYFLGGWPRPIGIEYRIDAINGLVIVVITAVGLITAIYSKRHVESETPDKIPQFYALYLLLVSGLLGMTLTGDAFNLYVLLEVASLTAYALIAMGLGRATLAAFKYVIMGTIGASFYLLGVGYLYIKTGSLNMVDIHRVLAVEELRGTPTIHIAFIFISVGVWIKMAFFPLHGWLPNAYSFAPSSSSCLIASLMTKVTIYVMIRMMLTVFGPDFVFDRLRWSGVSVWLSVVAILAGSISALAQTNLRKMFCYLIVAEVGYMVGGVWLANQNGLVGAVYHIISDAFMTLCLFLTAGVVIAQTGDIRLTCFKGLFRTMPLTMAGFTLGALSMIGIPPTCGFFSKWYLITGGIEAGQWHYVGALLVSSLINAILFFRIFEIALFADDHGHAEPRMSEAPASMLAPLLVTAISLLVIGLYNANIAALIRSTIREFGLLSVGG